MVKKGNGRVSIVLTPGDIVKLEYLCEKLDLKPTQIYRLALSTYYKIERNID